MIISSFYQKEKITEQVRNEDDSSTTVGYIIVFRNMVQTALASRPAFFPAESPNFIVSQPMSHRPALCVELTQR